MLYYHRGTHLNAMKSFCLSSLCSNLVLIKCSPQWVDAQNHRGLHMFIYFFKYDERRVPIQREMPGKKICSCCTPTAQSKELHPGSVRIVDVFS